MFHTCIRCYADLGRNETLEAFPVGRRLAFDAAKGRLWVVCLKCERWNLTPLEERWEAIEDCERRFRGTKLRVSTDNVGLARVGDGLDLVRIGSALRPEIAAWRYGDQFGKRRLRFGLMTAGGVVMTGVVVLGMRTGVVAGAGLLIAPWLMVARNSFQKGRTRVNLRLPSHEAPVSMRGDQLDETFITNTGPDWVLSVPYYLALQARRQQLDDRRAVLWHREYAADLRGEEALRAAAQILPAINSQGAGSTQVRSAVRLLEEAADPAELFMRFAPRTGRNYLSRLGPEVRLALEMAANEENERRAMEGELAHLEMEWRDAEDIAQIADDEETRSVAGQLDRLRGQSE